MLNKSRVWSLVCFLPGQAKDLSAPPRTRTSDLSNVSDVKWVGHKENHSMLPLD